MYPGVIVEYSDQSAIETLPIAEVRNRPLFCAVFSSDKGTEKWTKISGSDFFDMYGSNISFAKHGQPLLQAAMSINAGAELLCKRIVASDSSLANIGIVAAISTTEVQKTDDEGNLLYIDEEGLETTSVTETPAMVTTSKITYKIKSAANATTIETAKEIIEGDLEEGEYLLYVIADNGRGVSKKRIKIIPNYTISKTLTYTLYNLSIMEGSTEIESMSFSINPNLIVKNENISLSSMISTYSKQIQCIGVDSEIDRYINAFATAAGIDPETAYTYDPIFGCTNKGVAIPGLEIDSDGIDLRYSYGQVLQNGSNGEFGDYPFSNTDAWSTAAIEALDGTYNDIIFNVDQYKITAFVDANYPTKVKRVIEKLALFREDFMYFRDQGLGMNTFDLIESTCLEEVKSMFCTASFPQSYDVIDPYTKRQITVTMCYDIAQLLVAHCDNGCIFPTAGMKYNMVIKNAIYGTLSFAPTICPDPKGNQKEQLEELGVNYASYIDNKLVIETLYTSQTNKSQWSFINNVMGIQEVVKAIRTRCPAIRYTFIDGEDLEKYKAEVEEVIAPYSSNFKRLELKYVNDTTYSVNKIFYAVLEVVYRDFIQTEWFKVIALPTTTTVTA